MTLLKRTVRNWKMELVVVKRAKDLTPGAFKIGTSHRVGHNWSDLAAAAAAYRFSRGTSRIKPGSPIMQVDSLTSWATTEAQSEVIQSCPTLCNPMDYSLPGSSVHGILQAIVLEWVGISFFRASSLPRDWTQVSRIAGRPSEPRGKRELW